MLPIGNKMVGKSQKQHRGFTLIEVILYLAILSTLVFGIASFVDLISTTRVKNQVAAEVNGQALQIVQILTEAIHNAESITTPTLGGSQDNLTIIDQNNSSVTFALRSDKLTINRGTKEVDLNNDRVSVDSILFKNLSQTGTPDIIQITLSLSYKSDSDMQIYNYSKMYVVTANLYK